jgi:hypothetical protein
VKGNQKVLIYRYFEPICNAYIHPVGLFLCRKKNNIFNVILENIHGFYNPEYYQCLGSLMFRALFDSRFYEHSKNILQKMKIVELSIQDARCYLPFTCNELDNIFENPSVKAISLETNPDVIGVHWFNGSSVSKKYCNNIDFNSIKSNPPSCLADELIKQYL